MMHSAEPMTLGSPGSPATPGMVQSPFLPSYLMGEATPLASPGSRKRVGDSVNSSSRSLQVMNGHERRSSSDASPKLRETILTPVQESLNLNYSNSNQRYSSLYQDHGTPIPSPFLNSASPILSQASPLFDYASPIRSQTSPLLNYVNANRGQGSMFLNQRHTGLYQGRGSPTLQSPASQFLRYSSPNQSHASILPNYPSVNSRYAILNLKYGSPNQNSASSSPSSPGQSQPRMWSGGSSPPPSSHPPSLMSPTSPNSSSFHHNHSRLDRTSEILRTRKEKSGAPPVSGLLEDIASPAALDRSKMNMSQSRGIFNQSLLGTSFCGTPHQDDSVIYAPNVSTLNTSQVYQKRGHASPAQIDPFYTQGESIRPDDYFDETWITIFGFPAAASSFILQQFSQYGNIIKHVVATDGNWLHIKYQSKLQAKKALSKNGKVFGNSIMVGVAPCIDKSVMDNKENLDLSTSILNTPTQVSLPGTPNMDSRRNAPIRPLAAAYKAAAAERQVHGNVNTPQKSNGIVTKAMEYIFGW